MCLLAALACLADQPIGHVVLVDVADRLTRGGMLDPATACQPPRAMIANSKAVPTTASAPPPTQGVPPE